ncbi:DNA polymerase IV [Microlunatus parietis]|uniref:DNA polymerase IV n=1 Tax=Microlunatus parietis TaxID=682979 RepID=A0A7Y9IE49_9ACTN|nr:DNA polymerase IV [Microlunatus parietis]NYE74858.1 DNA polymerase-4 [Microlunatus parietis]
MAVILHVDMDAFFASVSMRRRPELRGTPVVVGGYPRGVVLSANYEARAYGIRSGMPSGRAKRLCPELNFIDPTYDDFSSVAKGIVAVFQTVTPIVEAASIDEAYLDLAGARHRFSSPYAIGEYVRAMVCDEQQITCSVGIGPSKFVAKMASRAAKPDGLIEVPPARVADFLHPMPVDAMFGVGPPTAEKLHRLGIRTIADLARTPPGALRQTFGPHLSHQLVELAWGRDRTRVVPAVPERGVGSQETFGSDTEDPTVVRRELLRMAAKTARRMRRAGYLGRTVTMSIRFADFRTLTRSTTLPNPTDVTDEIYAAALALLDRLGLDQARIRRVGIKVGGLVPAERAERQPFLDDPEFGWREAERAVDAAVGRFGPKAVQRAVLAAPRNWVAAMGAPGQSDPDRRAHQPK